MDGKYKLPSPEGEGRVRPDTSNGLYAAKGTIGFKRKNEKMDELKAKIDKLNDESKIHWEYILFCKETESPNFQYHKQAYNDKKAKIEQLETELMELKYDK